MNRDEKQAFTNKISEKLRTAQVVVLADYTGLSVESMNKLRRQLDTADKGSELIVVKNTLCGRAVAGTAMEPLTRFLERPTALIVNPRDPVSPAKVVTDFVKENDKFKIKAGFLGGKVIDQVGLKELSQLPSKEMLLGQLLGTLQAPLSQFVGVLAAAPQQFVGVLQAYKDSLEKVD